jgi:4-hydroxythreonine-4-phosphate dehydrogenase
MDYLNQELEGNALMLMVQGNLRVGLLLIIYLSVKASRLTEDLIIEKLKQ